MAEGEQYVEGIRRAFVSERRNLLLTSIVLLLVEYAELRFERINVLGNVAELSDHNVVRFLIWVFWFYFGWRYYQHYNEMTDASLKDTYRNRLYEFVVPISRKQYAALFEPSPTFKNQTPIFTFGSANWNLHKPWHATVNLPGRAGYRRENGALAQEPEVVKEIELHFKDLLLPNLKTAWYMLKNTRQITEYHLPFVVASLPLFYVAFKAIRFTKSQGQVLDLGVGIPFPLELICYFYFRSARISLFKKRLACRLSRSLPRL